MAPRVCARWRGLLPALGGAGLQDQGLSSAVSIINWLLARRHLHTVDGSHRLCDRRAARQCRLRRRAWEWACRCSCSLKLLRRSSLSERLFAFARERTHLFCTVIDSERYRMCTDSLRTLHGPKYSRARNLISATARRYSNDDERRARQPEGQAWCTGLPNRLRNACASCAEPTSTLRRRCERESYV